MGCDLLEKSYFCSIANNPIRSTGGVKPVVICLKNRTFAVSQTTLRLTLGAAVRCDLLEKSYFCSIANNNEIGSTRDEWLWFAWKIVLLQYRKQRSVSTGRHRHSCDLLEKSYFCSIANNSAFLPIKRNSVVICLKNRTFAVSQTTSISQCIFSSVLWFAWKIVLLQYRKQHVYKRMLQEVGCDLLEKSYFCSIANNRFIRMADNVVVVICLKNRTFAVSQTTPKSTSLPLWWLWFAWKIVLLQYRKQRDGTRLQRNVGCDLLEKSYFCSIANNLWIRS